MPEAVRPTRLVIVGRDDALWLSANILWRAFSEAGFEITVVELPSMLRPGEVYPTLKQQEAYHTLLGLREEPMMQAAQATYSLGQRFSNWQKTRPPFIHGYSTYGRPINRVAFHHYWVKARAQGMKAEFDDFSINAVAAKNGKFFFPGEDVDGFAICDYAYHLEAQGYCGVLKTVASGRGVRIIPGRIAEVVRDAETGDIASIRMVGGESVSGDLFIDASGSESALLGKALNVGFESWRKWFVCDRLMTTYAPVLSPLPSFSQVSAFRSGWTGMFPLQNCTAVQQVYASLDMADEQAFEACGIVTSMQLNPAPVVTPYEAGVRGAFWEKNCIAIGEAATVLDPIDSVRMHVNLLGLSHLISLMPVTRDCRLEREEYNRNTRSAVERIRDYQLCHYILNQRFGQPLWDHCRTLEVPDSLRYKLDLFAARGRLVVYDDETFEDDDWIAMLLGHGLIPQAYDPLADQISDPEAIQQFQKMLGFIRSVVAPMKPMEAALGRAATQTQVY
ncbi:MAG: tryptophan halogenase family protein [Asticcacaulis sp.]|uniref:tryptophan halogenase family protein n=1 Tax=Asticcacaulis sp. TaxID=1872648 RepID=UPI003F7C1095